MITNKEDVAPWQFADMFSAGYFQFIDDGKTGVRNGTDNGINKRSQWLYMFQSLSKSGHRDE